MIDRHPNVPLCSPDHLPAGIEQSILSAAFGIDAELPYMNDPVGWIENVCGEFMCSYQKEIARSFVEHRYTAVKAGHGVGKSWLWARIIAWWISTRPIGEAIAIFTAPTFNQVWSIVGKELAKVHKKAKLPGRLLNRNTEWWIGDVMVAQGLKPDDNNDDAFQGRHEKYVLGLGDEADGLPQSIWTGLDALATGPLCRVGVIGNPMDPVGPFATVCGDNVNAEQEEKWDNVITVSAMDSPNITGEYCPPEIAVQLVDQVWIEERRVRWGEGTMRWDGRVLGKFPKSAEERLISPEWIEAAKERELVGVEIGRYALDVARFGDSETCIYRNRGGVFREVEVLKKSSGPQVKQAARRALEAANLQAPMNIDGDGVGGPIFDDLLDDDYPVFEFRGGTTKELSNKEDFVDLRSEAYWTLREMFRKGEADIDPEDKALASQLANIKWKLTRTGKIQVETKSDMKARKVKSPDRADTVMMAAIYLGDSEYGKDVQIRRLNETAPPSSPITAGMMDEEF